MALAISALIAGLILSWPLVALAGICWAGFIGAFKKSWFLGIVMAPLSLQGVALPIVFVWSAYEKSPAAGVMFGVGILIPVLLSFLPPSRD